eukprot:2527900-Pyramimonas_sp.AAC.1
MGDPWHCVGLAQAKRRHGTGIALALDWHCILVESSTEGLLQKPCTEGFLAEPSTEGFSLKNPQYGLRLEPSTEGFLLKPSTGDLPGSLAPY